jgi:hypothetical protein
MRTGFFFGGGGDLIETPLGRRRRRWEDNIQIYKLNIIHSVHFCPTNLPTTTRNTQIHFNNSEWTHQAES